MVISVAPEPIFFIGNLGITNTTIISVLISIGLISVFMFLRTRLKMVPNGIQNLLEFTLESLLELTDSITQNRELSQKFFPLAATIFLFVILSNWVELIPGLGTVGLIGVHNGEETIIPFLRSGSADLNMTIALSIITVFFVQFVGLSALGLRGYTGKFFISPFRRPYIIGTFTGLLELVSEISRLVSFSFRLFGNIFAGEVLLLVMLNLVPYFIPLPFLILELFVGFIQAFVFSMLALVFMKMATLEMEH